MQQIVYDIIDGCIHNGPNNNNEVNSVHSDLTVTPPLSTKNGSNNSCKESQKDIKHIKKQIFFIDYYNNNKKININTNKKEKKILEKKKKIANESNNTLLNIIEYYNENNGNLTLFEEILVKYFENEETIILKIVFKWIEKLYNKFHENAFVSFDDFMEKFTFILANKNNEIFKEAINIICNIIKEKEKNLNIIISKIINTFQKKIDLIDKRGTDIFTILCSTLRVDIIFLTFATVLLEMKDSEYIGRIINRLNIFLIKSDITEDLRNVCKKVKNRNDRKDKIFFEKIFTTWCINPVSVLTLCLIAENFELSYNLLIKMYIIFFI